MAAQHRIHVETAGIESGNRCVVLAQDLGDADGVTRLDDGSFLVSEWPGRLFHVETGENTATRTLLDSREQKHYLNDFLRIDDLLLVPNWEPSTVSAYRIR